MSEVNTAQTTNEMFSKKKKTTTKTSYRFCFNVQTFLFFTQFLIVPK